MAQKVQVSLVSDVDGSVADETVTFQLDGKSFEIDVTEAQAKELRADFEKWTTHARKVSSSGRRARSGASSSSTGDAAAIREWANANGYTVNPRGRISAEVRAAFAAAH